MNRGRRRAGLANIILIDDGDAAPNSGAGGGSVHTYNTQTSTGPHTLLLVTWWDTSAGVAINSITWGGVSVSEFVQNYSDVSGADVGAAIFQVVGAQSGNIVITFNDGVQDSQITKISLRNLESAIAKDTDKAWGNSGTLNMPALTSPGVGGIRLAVVTHGGDVTPTSWSWAGSTNIADLDTGSARHAAQYKVGDESGTISATSIGLPNCIVGVSLR